MFCENNIGSLCSRSRSPRGSKLHLLFVIPQFSSVQFNSKTLIIPQGAILLWLWRAHKKIHKVKRTIQQTKESYFNRSIVVNIEQL